MLIDSTWLLRGVEYAVGEVIKALQKRLTFEDNLSQVTLDVESDPAPATTFTVEHNLGRIPQRWLANPREEVTVWEPDPSTRTETTLELRCSGSSTLMTLTVW